MNIPNSLEEIKTFEEALVFATVKVLEQGKASVDEGGMCRYRSPDGAKCAVGWLIADGKYEISLESHSSVSPSVCYAVTNSTKLNLTEDELEVLENLQVSHDRASNNSYRMGTNFIEEFKNQIYKRCELGQFPKHLTTIVAKY